MEWELLRKVEHLIYLRHCEKWGWCSIRTTPRKSYGPLITSSLQSLSDHYIRKMKEQ